MSSDKKLALVTGGTSGIGKELVYDLAIRNVDVVFTARNPTKAQSVVSELQERISAVSTAHNVGSISWVFCDLNDLNSVYKCAVEFKKAHSSLHIFVNNAGAVVPSFELNKDGYEANFSSNYLGHFLLTLELLAMLKSTAQELKEKSIGTESDGVRIIITSSFLHKRYNQDLLLDRRLHDAKTYGGGWKAYGRSKLMSLLFMKLLKEKVDAFGDLPIYINAVHPGFVYTPNVQSVFHWSIRWIVYIFAKPISYGAAPPLYLALSKDVVEHKWKGLYFGPKESPKSNLSSDLGKVVVTSTSLRVSDKDLAQQLWNYSVQCVQEKMGPDAELSSLKI